jgi:hypothetical protein
MRIGFLDTPVLSHPVLRSRKVRLLLIAAPAFSVMTAIFAAASPSLAVGILLSIVAGAIVAGGVVVVLNMVMREVADERILFARSLGDEHWHVRAQRLSSQHYKNGRLYADWYFRLRLQEELERGSRYNVPFTLLIAKKPGRAFRGAADDWLRGDIDQHLRRTDLPAILRDGSLGVILHHTAHYNAVRDRLTGALASVEAGVGLASFPKDATDLSALLGAADNAAQEDYRLRHASRAA